jgi:hypothetical protein
LSWYHCGQVIDNHVVQCNLKKEEINPQINLMPNTN